MNEYMENLNGMDIKPKKPPLGCLFVHHHFSGGVCLQPKVGVGRPTMTSAPLPAGLFIVFIGFFLTGKKQKGTAWDLQGE